MTAEEIESELVTFDGVIRLSVVACRLAAKGLSDEDVVRYIRARERGLTADPCVIIGPAEAVVKSALAAWRRMQ